MGRYTVETWTPPLGTFYLSDDAMELSQSYDNVIVCDMALPVKNIQKIAEKAKTIMIDHHHQDPINMIEHINPVAYSANGEAYPSTTWVIKEYLGLPDSLKVMLGYIGDREQKIKDNSPFWSLIQQYLKQERTEFDELLELVYRIDSSYKVGERSAVIKAPHLLREYKIPADILANKEWEKNLQKLNEKLERVLSEPIELINGVQVKRLDTPYTIISQVTRRLSWGTGKDAVVVNTGFFEGHDQLYCRSNIVDMYQLIERAKKLGYNAGGKRDVIGAIIPKSDTERFIAETIEYLKKNK
jgi:hypothetical protein